MAILIPAQRTAFISNSFTTTNNNTTSLVCNGLSPGEVVKVLVYDEVSGTYIDYLINNTIQQFNAQNPVIEIVDSALTYKISKPVTINNVGVSINQIVKSYTY